MEMPHSMQVQMALRATVPQIVFDLDGQDHSQPIPGRPAPDGGAAQGGGTVTIKAIWKKDGKQLELQFVRKMNMNGQERTTKTRDVWEFEKDGTLVVRRMMESPMGSQEVKLYFTKQA